MWMFQFLKFAFNSSFDYFLQRVKGRFAAFAIQLVLSYIAVGIFTFIVTLVAVPLLNQGDFSIDILSTDGVFQWMGMLDPVWLVTVAICVNYFFRSDFMGERMSFSDLYNRKSSGFWLDLSIACVVLAVIFIIFNHNALFTYPYNNSLEVLLDVGFEDSPYSLRSVLSNWIFYLVVAIPVVAIIVIEVRERKRAGMQLKSNIFKLILASIFILFASSWLFNNLLSAFHDLVLNLINIPFQTVEIPIFLGIASTIFIKTLELMFLSVFLHSLVVFAFGGSEYAQSRNESTELLDN